MAQNIYGPPMAQNIYGPSMAQNALTSINQDKCENNNTNLKKRELEALSLKNCADLNLDWLHCVVGSSKEL